MREAPTVEGFCKNLVHGMNSTTPFSLLALGALSLAAAPGLASLDGRAFSNPVWRADFPDPTVWLGDDGVWRAAATGGRILVSTNLVDWRNSGRRLFDDELHAKLVAAWRGLWAPCVTRLAPNGPFLLYISLFNGPDNSRIAVYASDSPDGPFAGGAVLTDSRETGIIDTIDPFVLRDPDGGKVWLFFGSCGKVHRVQLADDGRSLAPGASYVHVAGRTISESPDRDKVYEGTYLFRRNGWWYLFASRGHYNIGDYAVVVGRSRTLEGTFVDKEGRPMTEGRATPILSSEPGDRLYGPGHNGEIVGTPSGRTYMFYHCHDAKYPKRNPESRYNPRPLFLQEVLWDDEGWPYFKDGRPAESDILR